MIGVPFLPVVFDCLDAFIQPTNGALAEAPSLPLAGNALAADCFIADLSRDAPPALPGGAEVGDILVPLPELRPNQ